MDALFGIDVDNTVLTNWKGWDVVVRATSLALYGREFSLLYNPDGTTDSTFSHMTTGELWRHRLAQLGMKPEQEDEGAFYRTLDSRGEKMEFGAIAVRFRGVATFLESVGKLCRHKPTLLSTGPRRMQMKVLKDLNLLHRFDVERSLFYGECASKAQGLAEMAQAIRPGMLLYVGDAPSDMRALHSAACDVSRRLAIGVTMAGLSNPAGLIEAGADYIVNRYDPATMNGLWSLVRH